MPPVAREHMVARLGDETDQGCAGVFIDSLSGVGDDQDRDADRREIARRLRTLH
jgi:hypothetical protein